MSIKTNIKKPGINKDSETKYSLRFKFGFFFLAFFKKINTEIIYIIQKRMDILSIEFIAEFLLLEEKSNKKIIRCVL